MIDKDLLYNSFKLGDELRVASEFLDRGIKDLREYKRELHNHELFYVLYHFSVGIERLQKVLILLSYEDTKQLHEIKHHNHKILQHKINQKTSLKFNKTENDTINILSLFYKNYRYDTIEDNEQLFGTVDLMQNHNYIKDGTFKKEKFIKSLIKIILRYLDKIKMYERKSNYYTTETEASSSLARFSFSEDVSEVLKNYQYEDLAKIEILYYLINLKNNNSDFNNVAPIPLDEGMIKDYVDELINLKSSYSFVKELGAELESSFYKEEMCLKDDEITKRKETLNNLSYLLYFDLNGDL